MDYLEKDLWYFVNLGPYLSLSTVDRATKVLKEQEKRLRELNTVLPQFPRVQIEGLDFWYRTLRGLGMLNARSLEGMLTRCSWRGVVWGGWLALLHPRPEFARILERVATTPHGNEWAARCALAEVTKQRLEGKFEKMRGLANMCRFYINMVHIVPMPLRLQPSPQELKTLELERKRVHQAYIHEGTDAAWQLIHESRSSEILLEYPQWYRRHSDIPSRREYLQQWMKPTSST